MLAGASRPRIWRAARIALALAPLMAVHLALCAIPFIEFSWWYVVWVLVLTRVTGLGIFQVKKRPARMGRNPATGEQIKIKASKKLAFRPAKEVKDAI